MSRARADGISGSADPAARNGGAPERPASDLSHADSLLLLERQAAVLELLASGAPLTAVLIKVVAALEDLMHGARCSILLLDPATATLRHGAAPSLPDSYLRAIDGISVGPLAGSCGTAAYLGSAVVAEDILVDPLWDQYRTFALPHGLRSCWSTPIKGRTGTTGTFAVYHTRPHRPTDREWQLVRRVTHLASIAIDHAAVFGALAESEERFRHAFEDSAAGMALTDLGGRLVKVNSALASMLLRPERDLLVMTVGDLLIRAPARTEGDPAGLLADVAAARRESAQFEAKARRSDGKIVRVSVMASAVRGAHGQPVHLSLTIQDVTQRHIAERERRARREAEVAYEVADAASRAKSGFLTALSHELRTPLQAISGFAELLGTLDLPAERRQAALAHIQGATSHIISLVDDVLDIAKIEAGALPVHIAPVEIGSVIREVLDLLLPLAERRGITLLREPADQIAGEPGSVLADRRRLRQVLINLVTNAIRYNGPRGTIRVWVSERPGGKELAVVIADSGPGIAADKLDRLFVSFDRLGVDADEDQGAGLGLPLARGLMEAMGGQLLIESQVGVGTTASVILPGQR